MPARHGKSAARRGRARARAGARRGARDPAWGLHEDAATLLPPNALGPVAKIRRRTAVGGGSAMRPAPPGTTLGRRGRAARRAGREGLGEGEGSPAGRAGAAHVAADRRHEGFVEESLQPISHSERVSTHLYSRNTSPV